MKTLISNRFLLIIVIVSIVANIFLLYEYSQYKSFQRKYQSQSDQFAIQGLRQGLISARDQLETVKTQKGLQGITEQLQNAETYLRNSRPELLHPDHQGYEFAGAFFRAISAYLEDIDYQSMNEEEIKNKLASINNVLNHLDKAINEEQFVALPFQEARKLWMDQVLELDKQSPNEPYFRHYELIYPPYETVRREIKKN